jgi:tetratricopeptide (TPR) repeat protein
MESVSGAEDYERQALRLDPDFIRAHEYLAILLWNHTSRLDEVMILLRDAHAKDPVYIEIINLIAWVYLDLGDDAEAERWARHALDLAPQDCRALDALADVYHDRDDHAREFEILNLDVCGPGTMGSTEARFLMHYSCEGRYAEAIAIARAWQPVLFDPDAPIVDFIVPAYNIVAYIYSQTGRLGQAGEIWSRLLSFMDARTADSSLNQLALAQIYAAQMMPALSLNALEEATALGWRWLWRFLLGDCRFDFIRDDPRFQAVVAEIEADMRQQLAAIQELERAGQISMLP